jgi:tRNA A-37 threonylcarbamoyl transferase component Bud32
MSQLTGIAADPTMPKIGQRVVGRYDIVRLLGQGGFAAVFEAVDSRASGRVAIKVLHAEKSYDESFAKRFRQEVMLVRQLQHPNTIKITDAGTTETGCLFMVMEYVQGKELVDLMQRSGAMAPERVVRIGEQVLKALSEAHSKGIVHRDLKPQNIMVGSLGGEEDYVKVLDFGIAKALEPDSQLVQTQAGMVFCTPKYAAPEILMARGVTPAADVYALGLIMVEMATGRAVIDAPSEAETIARALSPEPIPIPPNILNTPLGQVLAKACAKTLAERYKNADDMLADLRRATQPVTTPSGFQSTAFAPPGSVSGQQQVATMHYQVQDAAGEPRKSRTGLLVTLGVLGLLIAGGVAAFAMGLIPMGQTSDNTNSGVAVVATPDAGTPEPEVIEEPTPPQAGPWMGRVATIYGGAVQQVETSSANISLLRLLDETALLNQLAMNMISQALLSNEIPARDREEAQLDYLQVVANLIGVMTELDLCDGASRRLDRAFNQVVLVPPNATPQISAMRRRVQECRTRAAAASPAWDARTYRDVIGRANELFRQAENIPVEQQAIREARFFESLGHQERGISMIRNAFQNHELRRDREIEGAKSDLYHLYEASVRGMLELGLRVSAEVQLEEILDNSAILPDEALQQSTELQLLLAQENRTYAERHGLGEAMNRAAPWEYARYQQVLQLAERLFTVTRGGTAPDDGGAGDAPPTQEGGNQTAEGASEAG